MLDRLCALARSAGRSILRHDRARIAVFRKPDGSPVTAADGDAQAVILAGLHALDPETPVVAEEAADETPWPSDAGSAFWLVDPLDGTAGFIAGEDAFTVNIALIVDGAPVLGVVHAPALDRTYFAGKGSGARRVCGAGSGRPIAARRPPGAGAVVVSSRAHGDRGRLAAMLQRIPVAAHRRIGSSLKFCLLAAGDADIYPRYGRTSEWDTAAGQAVLEAAGGSVETLDGAPLRYGKPDFRNPEFIARGRA